MRTKSTSIVLVIVSRKESDVVLQWLVPEITIALVVPVERIIFVFVSTFFEKTASYALYLIIADQCSDGNKDTDETDVDCGNACVVQNKKCDVTMICKADTDCISGACGKNETCVRKCS